MGLGVISHGQDEEKPKGKEHQESLQGAGAAGAAARLDRGDLSSVAVLPR